MNELYPIIRRKRRPLIVAQSAPSPLESVATKPVESVVSDSKPPKNDDQDLAKCEP